MAHGPVVHQNFSRKQYAHEKDFRDVHVFDALHQSFLVYFCIKNCIVAQVEDLSTEKVRHTPGGLCYRPFHGGGPDVILTLYDFVVFITRCVVLSLTFLLVLVFFISVWRCGRLAWGDSSA